MAGTHRRLLEQGRGAVRRVPRNPKRSIVDTRIRQKVPGVSVNPQCDFWWPEISSAHHDDAVHHCRFDTDGHGYHECVCGTGGGEQALRSASKAEPAGFDTSAARNDFEEPCPQCGHLQLVHDPYGATEDAGLCADCAMNGKACQWPEPADEVDDLLAKLQEGPKTKAPVQTGAVVHTQLDDLLDATMRKAQNYMAEAMLRNGPSFLGPTVSGEPSAPGQSQHSHANAYDFSQGRAYPYPVPVRMPPMRQVAPLDSTQDTSEATAGRRARLRSVATSLWGRCASLWGSEQG